MKERFIIKGGRRLEGEVEINGSKNGAAAVIAACLLTKEECKVSNLPLVDDILNLLDILKEMGCEVNWLADREVSIKADKIDFEKIDFEKFSKARTSVLLVGPLLGRFRRFKISKPGGDRIGLRPITTHLEALKKLGAAIEERDNFYYFSHQGLTGREIILNEFSVTATEALLMAACLAKGETIIKLSAQEPHVRDLARMLNKMGGRIELLPLNVFKVKGVKELSGAEHSVIADYLEAGTFLAAGAAVSGRVRVKNVLSNDLDVFLAKLEEIGIEFEIKEDKIEVIGQRELKPVKIQAMPFPGFPTDLLPLMVPILTKIKGKSLIHDPLYENRLNYVQELRKMGADIEIVDPHRAFVLGPTPLQGVSIESWDIRAGASLIIAGLMAQGTTFLNSIEQIDRGYERIEERLRRLGADIERISN